MGPGIDYSLGRSNFHPETGIHFGVISTHRLCERFYAQEFDYGPAHCPKCGNAAIDSTDARVASQDWDNASAHGCNDYACLYCEVFLASQDAFPDEACGWSIDDDGYKVIDCLDSDAMVLLAPYYTFAQYCSPCVPGAGNLESPCPNGGKCYCFGHDWFDGNVAPYPVYSVATGEQVFPTAT